MSNNGIKQIQDDYEDLKKIIDKMIDIGLMQYEEKVTLYGGFANWIATNMGYFYGKDIEISDFEEWYWELKSDYRDFADFIYDNYEYPEEFFDGLFYSIKNKNVLKELLKRFTYAICSSEHYISYNRDKLVSRIDKGCEREK